MPNNFTSQLYRYEALLNGIDLFSQKLGVDQIAEFAFEFANETLTLHASALFIRDKDSYVLRKQNIYTFTHYEIPATKTLKEVAIFYGNVITEQFPAFFSSEDIEKLQMQLVIPLMIHDELYGFIVSGSKAMGSFEPEDFKIAGTLMRLINNSLENSRHFSELKRVNNQLDRKIFSLFVINQSTKALLSQTELELVYSMATDVFAEVSGSRVTALGIMDEMSGKIKLVGYRNVSTFANYYAEFELATHAYSETKIVFELDNDMEYLRGIFKDFEQLQLLSAKYLVLIVKERILGFVTLSEALYDTAYDDACFELIESLATTTYIAVTNAKLFAMIQLQKQQIERKFDLLSRLNRLMNIINQGQTPDEICALSLQILQLSFGIKKAAFCFWQKESYVTEAEIGLLNKFSFSINEAWEKTKLGEMIYEYTSDSCLKYFPELDSREMIGDTNCIVIAPIGVKTSSLGEPKLPRGYLIVLEVRESLREEEVLLIETITKNISPVLSQMEQTNRIRSTYIEDPRQGFLSALQEKIKMKEQYHIDFYLFYRKINKHPFKDFTIEEFIGPKYAGLEIFYFDQIIFMFSYELVDDDSFIQVPEDLSFEEILNLQFSL